MVSATFSAFAALPMRAFSLTIFIESALAAVRHAQTNALAAGGAVELEPSSRRPGHRTTWDGMSEPESDWTTDCW